MTPNQARSIRYSYNSELWQKWSDEALAESKACLKANPKGVLMRHQSTMAKARAERYKERSKQWANQARKEWEGISDPRPWLQDS